MAKVRKISISLPKDMVDDIRYAVDSGRYATASEVVREAVREWKGKPRELPERVRVPKTKAEFRRRIQKSIEAGQRGEVKPAEEVFARLEAKYRALEADQKRQGRNRH
ncbi:MAG TPA: ribbon-helix-helix protein, CopG family [Rhizomicrobium sp.]|jgi:antitoxin ParD1/3/4|nr:ribbon-helix-helix protein, CopG family [Rhizomicrobium sp.]